MFELTTRFPRIYVNLEPGIYMFTPTSSTGKSFLAKTLREFRVYKEPVDSYTYNDYLYGLDLQNILADPTIKLLVIDRYDMIPDDVVKSIDNTSNKIILLDCKQGYRGEGRVHYCSLHLKESEIKITK